MLLKRYNIHPLLVGYIKSIWLFESSCGLPLEDMRLIVPNAQIKLVIPYKNGLVSLMEGKYTLAKDSSITIIGIADVPAIINSQTLGEIGTIGIEFSPLGAYRFFNLPIYEITNLVYAAEDLLGKEYKKLQLDIINLDTPDERLKHVEQFLLRKLMNSCEDDILDYCVKLIDHNHGKIEINTLSHKTGYTRRYLHMKFSEKVGISPKALSSIYRFQRFYTAWGKGIETQFFKKEFYDYYYDQSHFIKDFKRFTGHPPARFLKLHNEMGRIFYSE